MVNGYQDAVPGISASITAATEAGWVPPLIAEAADSSSEDHRRNCLAWYLFRTKTRPEILAWLNKQNSRFKADMRARLNTLRGEVQQMRQQVQEEG
ncbi:hypothetical protein MO867_18925 [Microbulbifer sp. OS29]|uniref:Uncharacterized protein n=1 Tax=Microbulbifer okhotskensis TaxID=2926617 RepID=A0A9X2EV10_9GAMM|nr:hypothetical protein [Microbulbifer okhotskensis]MCO1336411.1 hypothetical protein [Microbulbifer okhotskensis]